MSVATYITSIESSRNKIRNKLVELGMAGSADKLDKLAAAIEDIINQGAVNVTVQEGDTYTIPKGYHNGNGTVSGVSGGGNYTLQAKTTTPTKKQQNIAPDSGYYGLSGVTVAAIPDAYQDTSSVTAAAGDVLTGKVIVTADGTVTAGEMRNNGAVDATLDATTITYTIPKGYHNGNGTVKLVMVDHTNAESIAPLSVERKSYTIPEGYHDGKRTVSVADTGVAYATPSRERQLIEGSYVDDGEGNLVDHGFLSGVYVEPIPDEYQDVSGVTANPENVLKGTYYVQADGTLAEGQMINWGGNTYTIDAETTSHTIPTGYHNGNGKISIKPEQKTVTPNERTQTITPTGGMVLTKVTVDPIPDEYADVSGVTVVPGAVMSGAWYVDSSGNKMQGEMPVNGDTSATIDGLTTTSVTIPAGYTMGGTVSLTNDIETALSKI